MKKIHTLMNRKSEENTHINRKGEKTEGNTHTLTENVKKYINIKAN